MFYAISAFYCLAYGAIGKADERGNGLAEARVEIDTYERRLNQSVEKNDFVQFCQCWMSVDRAVEFMEGRIDRKELERYFEEERRSESIRSLWNDLRAAIGDGSDFLISLREREVKKSKRGIVYLHTSMKLEVGERTYHFAFDDVWFVDGVWMIFDSVRLPLEEEKPAP